MAQNEPSAQRSRADLRAGAVRQVQSRSKRKGFEPTANDAVASLKGIICVRCPVGKKCGAQKESDRLGSLIMCICHGPVDYCDEDYFTEVPILGDPRFVDLRERDD